MDIDKRKIVLDRLVKANFDSDAYTVVEILKSDYLLFLTLSDLQDLKLNILCRAENDAFSKKLNELNALNIYLKRMN